MSDDTKKKNGRPTKFDGDIAARLCFLAEKGLIDAELAYAVGISESTLNEWKKMPDFSESLKAAKSIPDSKVESSLYQRAIGGQMIKETQSTVDAQGGKTIRETIKELAPDATSMIFFLKNRKPDAWRERQELKQAIVTSEPHEDGEVSWDVCVRPWVKFLSKEDRELVVNFFSHAIERIRGNEAGPFEDSMETKQIFEIRSLDIEGYQRVNQQLTSELRRLGKLPQTDAEALPDESEDEPTAPEPIAAPEATPAAPERPLKEPEPMKPLSDVPNFPKRKAQEPPPIVSSFDRSTPPPIW